MVMPSLLTWLIGAAVVVALSAVLRHVANAPSAVTAK